MIETGNHVDNRVIIEVNQIVFQSMKKSPPPNLANDYFVTEAAVEIKRNYRKNHHGGGLVNWLKRGVQVAKVS